MPASILVIVSALLVTIGTLPMSDNPYSRIRVIYVLRPCALGFGLHNVRDIYSLKMALGCLVFLLLAIVSQCSNKTARY